MENPDFRRYLEEAIGVDNANIAFSAFNSPASVSIRYNPFKVKELDNIDGGTVLWNKYGRLLDVRPSFTLDPLFHAGAYYVQDSSSMFVGYVVRHIIEMEYKACGRVLKVLDLCAAPGGKTTDVAVALREILGDDFLLVANETLKQRATVLADNVAVWGDPNVIVTSVDASLMASLHGFFDIIIADVPCSGEGMFRKDEEAVRQWSVSNVELCYQRQRRIVADVWPALAEGGVMIYSTCTFNKYENDCNVSWISRTLGAEYIRLDDLEFEGIINTEYGKSLVPGFVSGEGQYCAAVRKTIHSPADKKNTRNSRNLPFVPLKKVYEKLFDREMVQREGRENIEVIPLAIMKEASAFVNVIRPILCGCNAATVKGKDIVPNADLALSYCLNRDVFPFVELSLEQSLAFLHRDTLVFPRYEKGFLVLVYKGLPIGFVKNLGNRCNNLHPISRRIRMNIDGVLE